jgi:hypothetical protein
LSYDALEFFERSKAQMEMDKTIKLATTTSFLRRTHPQYNWRFDRPMKHKEQHNPSFIKLLDPKLIHKVMFDGQIFFHVFAWMLSRSTYHVIIQDFHEAERWIHANVSFFQLHTQLTTSTLATAAN